MHRDTKIKQDIVDGKEVLCPWCSSTTSVYAELPHLENLYCDNINCHWFLELVNMPTKSKEGTV